MKKLFLYLFLGLLWCNVGVADSSWLKFPLANNETVNYNIKDAVEVGPNQYKMETVTTKDSKKIEYQKKSIENLTKYCGKTPGTYKVPKEMLIEGEITYKKNKTSSGVKPGEILVKDFGVVIFEIPYRKFEGFVAIFCSTNMKSKKKMANDYTPENEEKIIRENIRLLYQESIMVEYQDCRRRMNGYEIGGEIHWFPIEPGTNADTWNKEICKILDK